MAAISVVIVAKNEERNIGDCIKSCSFATEVLVIDDCSTDKTVEIAKSLGARVITRAMNGDWGGQQTFAIQQTKYEWLFLIDADERCTPELAEEIVQTVEKGEKFAYWIQRRNLFHHNKATHGTLRPDYVCRLMPKEGTYVDGYVHQAIVTPYDNKRLTAFMYHYTYDNWTQYLNKLNHYTTLAAEKYKKDGKSCGFFKDIIIRPGWAFFKMYVLDRGFLDGKLGWILAVNHYFYTLNKYVKLYYLYKSNGKL